MVSAKKHGGVPLYKLARQGKVVDREPRPVHVYRYTIDRIALPEIDFSVLCSKGFYVRTYVHDIGEALGCGAHLKSLRRTKSGRFDVANAMTIEKMKNTAREEILNRMLTLPEVSTRTRADSKGRPAHMGMSVTISTAEETDAEKILKLQYLCYQSEAELYGDDVLQLVARHASP